MFLLFPVPVRTSSVLYPSSLASICVLLSLLAFLLCFVIRLFNKNRFSQHRWGLSRLAFILFVWKLKQYLLLFWYPAVN